jgi:hypothetical protein
LHVFVDDAQQCAAPIRQQLDDVGITVHGMRQTRPRMEEAFISLIRRQREES